MVSVSIEDVAARRLAVAAATIPQRELGATIRRLLDQVWPVVRSQGVHTDHNVVVYLPSDDGLLHIEAGVEILSDFSPIDSIYESATPAGRVATAAHIGPYHQMHSAYAALDVWCREHSKPGPRVQWEVYGDWSEDPNQLRTDIYYALDSGGPGG